MSDKDRGLAQQLLAELNEATGQIQNATRCVQTIGLEYRPDEYCAGAHAPIRDPGSHKKVAAHRLREAIGNLKDCLRFLGEEVD